MTKSHAVMNLRAVIPNALTTASLGCGFLSLLQSFQGHYLAAIGLIFLSGVLDTVDGKVARMLKVDSEFGMEMDSLADLVAFGVAPAVLLYQHSLQGLGAWGVITAMAFVLCGGLRLARFNVLAKKNVGSCSKFFVGFPIPPAATLATTLVLFQLRSDVVVLPLVASFILLALSLLMVSPIPFPSFKKAGRRRLNPPFLVLLAGIALILLVNFQELFILAGGLAYLLFGLVGAPFRWLATLHHVEEEFVAAIDAMDFDEPALPAVIGVSRE